MTLELVAVVGLAFLDLLGDVVGLRAVVTGLDVVGEAGVEIVVVVIFVLEFGDPLGSRAVEDHLGVVALLEKLRGHLEGVDDATEVGEAVRACQDDDCCVGHASVLGGRYVTWRGVRVHAGHDCPRTPRTLYPRPERSSMFDPAPDPRARSQPDSHRPHSLLRGDRR